MNKQLRLFLLALLIFSGLNFPAYAQQTQFDLNSYRYFRIGEELFESRHYGSSIDQLSAFLNSNPQNEDQRARARYMIAVSHFELFQADALEYLNDFIKEYPTHSKANDARFYSGKLYFRQKQYTNAVSAFESIDGYALNSSDRGEMTFMKGYSQFKTGKPDAAKETLSSIKDAGGENGTLASYYYGYISYDQGKYTDALKEFEKIKNEKRFRTIIPVYIAQIHLLQGNYDKAIAEGTEALKDSSTEKAQDIQLTVAEAYFYKKDYKSSLENYQAYIRKGGEMKSGQLYQYGFLLYQSEKFVEAIAILSQIEIKEDSLGQNVAYHLAGSYLKTGEQQKARTSYDYASHLKFDKSIREKSLYNYAALSYELNFEKEAIESYKQLLKEFPGSKSSNEVKEALSNILVRANNPKDALDVLETIENKSDKLQNAYQKVLYAYALELFKAKDYIQSKKYLEKSLAAAGDRKIKALSNFWLGELAYRNSNYEEAQNDYKSFLYISESQETPYFNIANYNIAYTYFKKENYFYANTYFEKFLKGENSNARSSRYTDAQLRSGDCQFVQKNYSDALGSYQQVINSRAPEADYALYQKGIILGLQRKSGEKLTALRNLVRQFPNSSYLDDTYFAIAEELKNQDKADEAIASYQSLNKDYPKNPYYRAALLNIGLILYNQQQDQKALGYFKGIIKLFPFSPEAKNARKQIENIYIENHESDSLEAFLQTLPDAGQKNSSIDSLLYASAYSAVKANDCKAAYKSLSRYLEKFPTDGYYSVDAHFYRAECSTAPEKIKQTIEDYNFVINRSPNSFLEKALKASALINFREGNFDMSVKRYEQLEDYTSVNQNILLALMGQMRGQFQLRNYQQTITVANKIINLSYADEESKTEAQLLIGRSNQETKQFEQALAYFEKVYKVNKAEFGAEAIYNASVILFLQEKYNESEQLIYKVNEQYSNYGFYRAKAFILLADIYSKRGDYFTAKNTLQSIIDNYDGEDIKKIAQDKLVEIKALETKVQQNKAKQNDEE